MEATKNNNAEIIIAQNNEEWKRLLFLLSNPEENAVFWINCDTARIKKPLHDALHLHFSKLKPCDIYIDETTVSLRGLIIEQAEQIPHSSIIHVFGIEDAARSVEFLANLNFQRDSLFRQAPANIIFWADFATGTILSHRTYDFWSWIVFTFNFSTPVELLTARQKGFTDNLMLEHTEIKIPSKDSTERIRHLEHEWDEFLRSVNGKPSTVKQMRDAVTIVRALAMEYRDDGDFQKASETLQKVLIFDSSLMVGDDYLHVCNELSVMFSELSEFNKAEEVLEGIIKTRIDKYGENDIEVATLRCNLAAVFRGLMKFIPAKHLLEEALKVYQANLEEDDPRIAVCQSILGLVYCDLDELPEAKVMLEAALDSDIKNFGSNHTRIAKRLSNLGTVYRDLGEFGKVKNLLLNALSIDIINFGENHPNVAICYSNLAYISLDLNQKKAASQYAERSYEIKKRVFGDDNPKTQAAFTFLQNLNKK